MANGLKMAVIHAIEELLKRGWSHRRIARELGVHRETVARYERLRGSKPAISTPGSGPPVPYGRKSHCDPFVDLIRFKLDQGLGAQRIFQDLRAETGFTGSYSSVKRFARRLGATTPLPFRRIEVAPGQEAQVDFGSGPWIIEAGHKRRTHILRITLSHSRKGYSEAIHRQTADAFIRCLENAWRHFGGVPAVLVPDNLKAAVTKADWFDPDLNPKIVSFARHYGIAILPTRPASPREKGKIESGIKYVKNNAVKARIFGSLADLNGFLLHWERTVADTRIHGTTKRQVRAVFEAVERATLKALPPEPFPLFHEGRRVVHRDGHVEVAKAYYSVPPEYLGRQVWVRYDSRLVRIYNDRLEQIAIHGRTSLGRFRTDWRHIPDEKISAVERGAEYLLAKADRIGSQAGQWARAMMEERGIEGIRVLQGFVGLARKHSAATINRASRTALDARLFRLRSLRELCGRLADREDLRFAESHPIIRPLSDYQDVVRLKSPERR
ncbi:MAG: IS21 family transposase [Candidatus Eisenbacteria bacterium]